MFYVAVKRLYVLLKLNYLSELWGGEDQKHIQTHIAGASDLDNYTNLRKGFILHFRTYTFT